MDNGNSYGGVFTAMAQIFGANASLVGRALWFDAIGHSQGRDGGGRSSGFDAPEDGGRSQTGRAP